MCIQTAPHVIISHHADDRLMNDQVLINMLNEKLLR